LELQYNYNDLTKEYYGKIKKLGDAELEHQIGRLSNFKAIIAAINKNKIKGGFVEFGTWRGFSLLWTVFLAEREGFINRKFIGMDSFSGLPNSEGVFKKGAFGDTSLAICKRNIARSNHLYPFTKKQVYIEQFSFKEGQKIAKRIREIGASKFVFVHIDCDLSSSAKSVFNLLTKYDLLNDKCFILFDDYGMKTNLAKTVDEYLNSMKKTWKIRVHSTTKITKNYYLVRKNYENKNN
jgi:hypothetical protein